MELSLVIRGVNFPVCFLKLVKNVNFLLVDKKLLCNVAHIDKPTLGVENTILLLKIKIDTNPCLLLLLLDTWLSVVIFFFILSLIVLIRDFFVCWPVLCPLIELYFWVNFFLFRLWVEVLLSHLVDVILELRGFVTSLDPFTVEVDEEGWSFIGQSSVLELYFFVGAGWDHLCTLSWFRLFTWSLRLLLVDDLHDDVELTLGPWWK